MKQRIWKNKSNGQLCVTIPKNSSLREGDFVELNKSAVRRIAYNGVVGDLFHYGHLHSLQFAKSLADINIVGVLTDEAVEQYRVRPLSNLKERRVVIESLQCVDRVMVQHSRDHTENLRRIHEEFPDAEIILVHGDDLEDVPGADYVKQIGGRIVKHPYYARLSNLKIANYFLEHKGRFKDVVDFTSLLLHKIGRIAGGIPKPEVHNKIVVSSEAQVLQALRPLLRKSLIWEMQVCSEHEWEENPSLTLDALQEKFPGEALLIRNCAVEEKIGSSVGSLGPAPDATEAPFPGAGSPGAGRAAGSTGAPGSSHITIPFSVPGVEGAIIPQAASRREVEQAVKAAFASARREKPQAVARLVLVQRYQEDLILAGNAFCSRSSAPYWVVTLERMGSCRDVDSGLTNAKLSGSSISNYIFPATYRLQNGTWSLGRQDYEANEANPVAGSAPYPGFSASYPGLNQANPPLDSLLDSLRESLEELDALNPAMPLDISFGMTADGKCVIFALRPLPLSLVHGWGGTLSVQSLECHTLRYVKHREHLGNAIDRSIYCDIRERHHTIYFDHKDVQRWNLEGRRLLSAAERKAVIAKNREQLSRFAAFCRQHAPESSQEQSAMEHNSFPENKSELGNKNELGKKSYLKHKSNQELCQLYTSLLELVMENGAFFPYSREEITRPLKEHILRLLQEKEINALSQISGDSPEGDSREKLLHLLLTPTGEDIFWQEEKERLELCLHQNFSDGELLSYAGRHPWRFVNTYSLSAVLEFLRQEMRETQVETLKKSLQAKAERSRRLQQQQEELFSRLGIPELRELCLFLQEIAVLRLENKRVWAGYEFQFLPLFEEIASRTGLTMEELLYSYRIEEIQRFLSEGHALPYSEVQQRLKYFNLEITPDGATLCYTPKYSRELLSVPAQKDLLRGEAGNGGKIIGRARVVTDDSIASLLRLKKEISSDDIYVTTMTHPAMVPLLHHVRGIITDEGGITSHAAIISRELGIPCLVGTRNSTSFFKNGELIELNAHNNYVRRLTEKEAEEYLSQRKIMKLNDDGPVKAKANFGESSGREFSEQESSLPESPREIFYPEAFFRNAGDSTSSSLLPYIIPFRSARREHHALLGGKGKNLAVCTALQRDSNDREKNEITNEEIYPGLEPGPDPELDFSMAGPLAGTLPGSSGRVFWSVPPGFCLTRRLYDEILAAYAKRHGRDSSKSRLADMRSFILDFAFDANFLSALQEYLQELQAPAFAVRSSASCEDSASFSFAGQFKSLLGVRRENIIPAIRECLASAFAEHVFHYLEGKIPGNSQRKPAGRGGSGQDAPLDFFMGVVVQEFVPSDKAGVLFTVHPRDSRRGFWIEANFGVGESVVSGKVKPDQYFICDGEIHAQVPEGKESYIYSPDGSLSLQKKTGRVLGEQEIHELASLGSQLREHFSREIECEWAFYNNALHLLQVRPITTLRESGE